MKALRFLSVILIVGSIFPIIAYLSNTKGSKIKKYLDTYQPELTYEIESFKKDTFYYRDYDELDVLYGHYDTQLEMLTTGNYTDSLLKRYTEKVDASIQYADSVYIRPYYLYMLTGDVGKMDKRLNVRYGYTVKLKTQMVDYHIGILEDRETKILYNDTRKELHHLRDAVTDHELFNNRIKELYPDIPTYPHQIKNDTTEVLK